MRPWIRGEGGGRGRKTGDDADSLAAGEEASVEEGGKKSASRARASLDAVNWNSGMLPGECGE